MIQSTEYQSIKSRFWLFVLIWCVCLFGLACTTKYLINLNYLVGNSWGIFIVCVGWWLLGALCVILDNYRRTICTVCSDKPESKPKFKFWNHVLDFYGRATRREFWWGLLTYGIIIWMMMAAIMIFLQNGILALVACLVFLIPVWALFVRRLHDIGAPGWWVVVPCFGGALCVVSWFCAVLWNFYLYVANVGTDVWGIIIYVLSALVIGLIPNRNVRKVK